MTGKRDSLIERYLEGRMTAPEERLFRQRLEEDEQLLEMLRTELLIRSTMAGERGRVHARHSRARARAMAMLAAAPRGAEVMPAATASAAASGGGAGGMLSGLAAFKGIVTMVAVAAAAAGSYITFVPSGTPAGSSPAPAPAYRDAGAPAQTEFPPQPAPAASPAMLPDAAPAGPEQSATAETAPASARKSGADAERTRPSGELSSVPPAASQNAGGKTPEETIIPATPEQPAAVLGGKEPPVTIRNDTLRTRLKIESMQRP